MNNENKINVQEKLFGKVRPFMMSAIEKKRFDEALEAGDLCDTKVSDCAIEIEISRSRCDLKKD